MKEEAWTWEELRRIERARGERFVEFLRAYGLRGALALELTRTMRACRPCALHALTAGSCKDCIAGVPVIGKEWWSCAPPWTVTGRSALIRVYTQMLRREGRLPRARRV